TDANEATQGDDILDLLINGFDDEARDDNDSGRDGALYPGESTFPGQNTYPAGRATGLSIYSTPVDFLHDGLAMVYRNRPEQPPAADGSGGVNWQFHARESIAELEPPRDMWSRLESLPQSYLKERGVKANFKLATNKTIGRELVEAARNSTDAKNASLWPEAHYLGPLHPVLDWVADRALSRIPERGGIYIVRADVAAPTVIVHAGLTNRRGQMVSSVFRTVTFPEGDPDFGLTGEFENAAALIADLGLRGTSSNQGPVDTNTYQPLVRSAGASGEVHGPSGAARARARMPVADLPRHRGRDPGGRGGRGRETAFLRSSGIADDPRVRRNPARGARRSHRRGDPVHPVRPAAEAVAVRSRQPASAARDERNALAHPAAGVREDRQDHSRMRPVPLG